MHLRCQIHFRFMLKSLRCYANITGRHVQPDLHRHTLRYNTKIGRSWNIRYPRYAPGNYNQICSETFRYQCNGFVCVIIVILRHHFDPADFNQCEYQCQREYLPNSILAYLSICKKSFYSTLLLGLFNHNWT